MPKNRGDIVAGVKNEPERGRICKEKDRETYTALNGQEELCLYQLAFKIKLVSHIKNDYEYILLDTMPSLNFVTINALNAADYVLIPVQPQYFSLKGLELLFDTIRNVKRNLNPALEISGVLVTMYDSRMVFHRHIVEVIEKTYEGHFRLFSTKIPASVKATESQAQSMSIFEHDPTGKIAAKYERFVRELLGEV